MYKTEKILDPREMIIGYQLKRQQGLENNKKEIIFAGIWKMN